MRGLAAPWGRAQPGGAGAGVSPWPGGTWPRAWTAVTDELMAGRPPWRAAPSAGVTAGAARGMRAARSRRFSWDLVALRHVAGAQSMALEISLPISDPNPACPTQHPFSPEEKRRKGSGAQQRAGTPVLSSHGTSAKGCTQRGLSMPSSRVGRMAVQPPRLFRGLFILGKITKTA